MLNKLEEITAFNVEVSIKKTMHDLNFENSYKTYQEQALKYKKEFLIMETIDAIYYNQYAIDKHLDDHFFEYYSPQAQAVK